MTIRPQRLTKQQVKEMDGTSIGMEVFEEYYENDIEPLTQQEWIYILRKYDDSHQPNCDRLSEDTGNTESKEWCSPNEEILTNVEWAEIMERFGGNDTDTTEGLNSSFDINILEEYYGLNSPASPKECSSNYLEKKRRRRRLPRRGGRTKRRNKGTADLNILHSNCDGYISKKASIENIVNAKDTDVLLLNETALKGKRKVKIKDYFSFSKKREKIKGRVATVIANHLKPHTVKVTEGKDGDEYLITRLDHVIPAVNIVNIYGHQESRIRKDEITESWLRLIKDLEEIETKGEALLIIGDLVQPVGCDR